MKKLCVVLLAMLGFACGKKGSLTGTIGGLGPVKSWLKDSLTPAVFDSLNFSEADIATDTGGSWFVRIPLAGFDVKTRFILVKTDKGLLPISGAELAIERTAAPSTVTQPCLGFYGTIRKTRLNGTLDYSSAINGGYVAARHRRPVVPLVAPAESEPIELPEIVIYAPDPDYYASYDLLLDDGGGNSGFTGYSNSGSGGGASGGGGSAASAASGYSQAILTELQASQPGINITAYLTCFGTIPDNSGTTYTAALLVKVPDPSEPDIMWDPFNGGGVGHAFIQLTKTNGNNSITEYLGFYGQGGIYAVPTALGFSVPSKMVNNSGHPYNASLTVSMNQGQFSQVLTAMGDYANTNYNISSFNCSTYAISVFDDILPQSSTLSPPQLAIPGQIAGDTPNGLFIQMQGMPSNTTTNGMTISVNIFGTMQTAGKGNDGGC